MLISLKKEQNVHFMQRISSKMSISGLYSLKCWFRVNVWLQGCWFHLEASKNFMRHVSSKTSISGLKSLKCWFRINVWLQGCWFHLQSWTKVLTHLSKTNAFYRRPSVTLKSIFFVDSQPPSPPFQCCNTLRGEGVEMSKLDIENSLVERNGLNYFCPWLSELYFTHSEAFPVSLLFVYSEIFSIIV